MKISNDKQLNSLLPRNLKNDYSIGLHGIEGEAYWKKDENDKYVIDTQAVEETQKSILEKGLKIAGDRNLLSTVKFDDLQSYINPNGYYQPGGIIIAIPKMLESTSGKHMFIGSPNEFIQRTTGKNWDRNREATSLAEIVLVGEGNILPPEFILGTYTKDDDGIVVQMNERHMAFGDQKVSDEYIKECEAKIGPALRDEKITLAAIKETQRQRLQYESTHGLSLLKMMSKLKGTPEATKEVKQIFGGWLNKTKEREDSKENGIR